MNIVRRWLLWPALAAFCMCASHAQTSITDATGRTLRVPVDIRKVYAAGPPASVFVLALAPEELAGWDRAPTPDELAYLPPEVARLPVLGRLTGRGNTANVEVVTAVVDRHDAMLAPSVSLVVWNVRLPRVTGALLIGAALAAAGAAFQQMFRNPLVAPIRSAYPRLRRWVRCPASFSALALRFPPSMASRCA